MSEIEHPRATTATIDRRVERLELNFESLDRKVDRLTLSLENSQELTKLQLQAIQNAIETNATRLDGFIAKIEGMILEALKDSGDLRASAVGRSVDDRLSKMEAMIDSHEGYLDAQRGAGAALVRYGVPLITSAAAVLALVLAWPK